MISEKDIMRIKEFLKSRKVTKEKLFKALREMDKRLPKKEAFCIFMSLLMCDSVKANDMSYEDEALENQLFFACDVLSDTVAKSGIEYLGQDLEELDVEVVNESTMDIQFLANNVALAESADVLYEQALEMRKTREEKVMEMYGWTLEQFKVVIATLVHEAGEDRYDEGYNVASALLNRIHCLKWINAKYGQDLFKQLTRSGQFSSYLKGYYWQYMNDSVKNTPAYDGIVDALLYHEPCHDYMSFNNAQSSKLPVQLVPGKNWYGNELLDSDRVECPVCEKVRARSR